MTQVAVEGRQRIYNLTEADAKSHYAVNVLGRLHLAGHITISEHDAGQRLHEWHADAMRALKAPDPLAKGSGKTADGDIVSEDYVEWATRAIVKWELAKGWLEDCGRWAHAEVLRVAIADRNPYQVKTLAYGLGSLAVRMGIAKQVVREAAE